MTKTPFFRPLMPWLAGAFWSVATLAGAGQQPAVVVHGDDITIRGCVDRVQPGSLSAEPMLVWTRGDIMLSNAKSLLTGASTERVFYWLDDDDDLGKHIGQMIEVKGDLGEFEKGEVEIDKDGDFTKIELKLGGKTEKARVPTAWLGGARGEAEFDIVARKIDVDEVKVVGPCPVR
jgi:hypothetical protein